MKLFDFDDILICPTRFSDIRSRSEINVRYTDGMLPLMTAPMDTVISLDNFHYFKDQGIVPVIPRIEHPDKDWWDNDRFFSYGIEDFERILPDAAKYFLTIPCRQLMENLFWSLLILRTDT